MVGLAALAAGLVTSPQDGASRLPRHRAMDVSAAGLRLRAVRAGAGPAVILLHGYGESLLAWESVFDRLTRQADIVALDLPGFGLSSKPATGYATDSLAADVLGAMDALRLERAVLVGHSLGGAVAAAAALAAPERVPGLVLIDPAVVTEPWLRRAENTSETTGRTVRRGVAQYEALRMRFSGAHDPAWLAESDSAMAYSPSGDAAYVTALQAVLREFDFAYLDHERARRLRTPTLIIWGAYDPTVSVSRGRALAASLPAAEFRVVGRSWHRPHVERPAEVAGLIAEFLRGLSGARSADTH